MKTKGIMVMVLILLFVSTAWAGDKYYTKGGQIIAISEDVLDTAIEMVVNGDSEGIQRLMEMKFMIISKPNIQVFIQDTHIFTGKVEVRPKGFTSTFWMQIDGIQKK